MGASWSEGKEFCLGASKEEEEEVDSLEGRAYNIPPPSAALLLPPNGEGGGTCHL